ncbi:MAG: zinc ribbon domain-containing protein [Methanomassiliicoccaceae archaeon]|jgi:hypothetical protein|nr:zinc ribbon domain-containing protein [Methanomassiliicoccaceae archaeon]
MKELISEMRYDIMDDLNFCPVCGKNLDPGTAYCPACGARLNDPEPERREKAAAERTGGGNTNMAMILLSVTAAILFAFGLIYLSAAGLAEEMFSMYPSLEEYYTVEAMRSMIRMFGIILIIGAAMCVVSAILTFKRRLWVLALILCIAAALFGVLSTFGVIAGIIAIFFLYKARPAFRD